MFFKEVGGNHLKKYVILALFICVIIAVSGCTLNGWGSGNVINETKNVKGVKQVSLEGFGNIVLQQGNQESLRIEAEDNIMPHIQSKVDGDKLTITYDTNTPTPTKDVTYYLTVKDLNSISISGAGKIQSNNFKTNTLDIILTGAGEGNLNGLNVKKLTVNMSGAGKLILSGKATEQTVNISGAGDYQARELESKTATITIGGAGSSIVNVTDLLNAVISGVGDIEYTGNPKVNKQISGTGNIQKITS